MANQFPNLMAPNSGDFWSPTILSLTSFSWAVLLFWYSIQWDYRLLRAWDYNVQDGSVMAGGGCWLSGRAQLSWCPELLISPLHGLSMWIKLHLAWHLGSKSRVPDTRKWNLKIFLRPGPGNYTVSLLLLLIGYRQSQDQWRFKEKGNSLNFVCVWLVAKKKKNPTILK